MTIHAEFAFVYNLVCGIRWDAKYATRDNLTGKPVEGYRKSDRGLRALCAALDKARELAASLGFGLVHGWVSPPTSRGLLVRWWEQPEDGRKKLRHYPNINRPEMFEKGSGPQVGSQPRKHR